jgi:hypothetical protein
MKRAGKAGPSMHQAMRSVRVPAVRTRHAGQGSHLAPGCTPAPDQ